MPGTPDSVARHGRPSSSPGGAYGSRSSEATPPPAPCEVQRDVAVAIALASHGRASGELVGALRRRLCAHIRVLAPEARRFANALPGESARFERLESVRQALAIGDAGGRAGPEPTHSLRVLAKAADALNAMVLAGGHAPTGPRRQRAC